MAVGVASAAVSGCLVLSLAPLYDSESMGWDARLVGSWIDEDDHASMEIGRAEWQSYRVHYVHPIETGDLTGYLTEAGEIDDGIVCYYRARAVEINGWSVA